MGYFIMRRGPNQGKLFRLVGDEVSIGRGTKNTIVIDDNEVSREHLKLKHTDAGYELRDLNSSNGTFINGQPVSNDVWLLQAQCIVELGDHITLEYHPGDPEEYDDESTPIAETLASNTDTKVPANFLQHYLVVTIHNQQDPAIYPLSGRELKVGRGVNNDIVIIEPEMSRVHFKLVLTPGRGYSLEDVGSTNGTLVNGELVEGSLPLKTDDIIQIGTMVNIQYSANPDSFLSQAKTETIGTRSDTNNQQTTPLNTPQPRTTKDMPDIVLDRVSEPKRITSDMEEARNLKEKVLVTYSEDEWDGVVKQMIAKLKAADIGVWVDHNLKRGTEDWRKLSEQARLECPILVVVVSSTAMNSEIVKRNWRHFHNREKPIVLFVHELVDQLPIGSDKLAKVDFNPAVPDVAYDLLINEIKQLKK